LKLWTTVFCCYLLSAIYVWEKHPSLMCWRARSILSHWIWFGGMDGGGKLRCDLGHGACAWGRRGGKFEVSSSAINQCPLVKSFYRTKNTRERCLSYSDKQRTDDGMTHEQRWIRQFLVVYPCRVVYSQDWYICSSLPTQNFLWIQTSAVVVEGKLPFSTSHLHISPVFNPEVYTKRDIKHPSTIVTEHIWFSSWFQILSFYFLKLIKSSLISKNNN